MKFLGLITFIVLSFVDANATELKANQFILQDPGSANKLTLKTQSMSSSFIFQLPQDDGTSGQFLHTDGSGVLSWQTVVSGINQLTGDVTAGPGSGSQVATISNLAVTNAKIANATIDLTTKVTGVLPVANGGTNSSSYTAGSVIFAGSGGTSLTQDNTGIFYDDTNNRLGLGIVTPQQQFHIDAGTGIASLMMFTNGATTGTTATDGFAVGISSGGVAQIRNREATNMQFFTSNLQAFSIMSNGNVGIQNNTGTSLATTATTGFFYINTTAGTPTGVPSSFNGGRAVNIDLTNDKFYFYSNGWQSPASAVGSVGAGDAEAADITNGVLTIHAATTSFPGVVTTASQSFAGNKVFTGSVKSETSLILEEPDAGTNTVTIQASNTTGTYSLTLPDDDGSANQVLTTDGSGVLTWSTPASASPLTTKGDLFTFTTVDARLPVGTNGQILSANSATATGLEWIAAPSAGANTALSNLSAVAINTSLISDTDNTDDLGSDSIEWKDTWTYSLKHNSAGTPALTITTTGNNGNISLEPHGTGIVSATKAIKSLISLILEDPGAGTNTTTIQSGVPTSSYTLTLPVDDGSANQVLTTDGSGVLTWTTPTTGTITDWTSYTPTFTGFGTVSTHSFWYKRINDTMYIKGTWTSGTATATEARISLGNSETSSSTKINSSIEIAGYYARGASPVTSHGGFVTLSQSQGYIKFGNNDTFGTGTSVTTIGAANGDVVCPSSNICSLKAEVPIEGW